MRGLNKRAYSETLSALIIGATILAVTLISAEVATYLLENEMQRAEFKEAESAMLILADVIEDVATKMLSSGYVKFNCRAGGVDFLNNTVSVQVFIVTDSGEQCILSEKSSIIRYRGGSSLADMGDEFLRGTSRSIVFGEASPLISVRKFFDGRPIIQLESTSMRVVPTGTLYLQNIGNGTSGYVNVYEVVFIKISIGRVFGVGSINVKAYSKNVTVTTIFISQVDFQLKLVVDGYEVVRTVDGADTYNGNPVVGSLFYVVVVYVEISTV